MRLVHLPHPKILDMGLAPLAPGEWVVPSRRAESWLEHKLQLRAHLGHRAFAVLPGSRVAQEELHACLLGHLLEDHACDWQRRGDWLSLPGGCRQVPLEGGEPLWAASLWVAEDLLLMQADSRERYRLTAASLCSPSHWQLEDKLGQTLPQIHAPIPGFAAQLDARIDRFFHHLKVERPVLRFNWGLQRGNGRCQREDGPEQGEGLYYRVERQTLRRLPKSGAVVFAIRVFLHPLADLAARPGALSALFEAIDACPPELAEYKGFPRLQRDLEVWRQALSRGD